MSVHFGSQEGTLACVLDPRRALQRVFFSTIAHPPLCTPLLPPVLPTLGHISARKTASVTGKNLKLTQVVVLIEITAMISRPERDFSELSPRKQPLSPQVTESRSDLFTDVIM